MYIRGHAIIEMAISEPTSLTFMGAKIQRNATLWNKHTKETEKNGNLAE
jgi:hypothetical protein